MQMIYCSIHRNTAKYNGNMQRVCRGYAESMQTGSHFSFRWAFSTRSFSSAVVSAGVLPMSYRTANITNTIHSTHSTHHTPHTLAHTPPTLHTHYPHCTHTPYTCTHTIHHTPHTPHHTCPHNNIHGLERDQSEKFFHCMYLI